MPIETGKRVAFFVPSLAGGGTERVMIDLANATARQGVLVDLVLCQAIGVFLPEVDAKVQIVNLKGRGLYTPLWPLRRYLRKTKPVAMFSALNGANLLAVIAKCLGGVPTKLILTVHNHVGVKMERNPRWFNPLKRVLLSLTYRNCDGVVAVSEDLRRFLVEDWKIPADQVVAIKNPLDLCRIEQAANVEVEHPWFTDRRLPVALAIGRLETQKDYPTLLKALAVANEERGLRLVVLGEGSEKASLIRLSDELGLEGLVDFVGFQAQPLAWLSRADVFALSSQWEGSSLVILEAMALGKPIVSTDCACGPRENLTGYPRGELVPVGDSVKLGQALARAVVGGEAAGVAALSKLLEHESGRVARRYLELIR